MDYIIIYPAALKRDATWINTKLLDYGMRGGLFTDFDQYDYKLKFFVILDYNYKPDETFEKLLNEANENGENWIPIYLLSNYTKSEMAFMPLNGLDPHSRFFYRTLDRYRRENGCYRPRVG